jgi:hypothetical protein
MPRRLAQSPKSVPAHLVKYWLAQHGVTHDHVVCVDEVDAKGLLLVLLVHKVLPSGSSAGKSKAWPSPRHEGAGETLQVLLGACNIYNCICMFYRGLPASDTTEFGRPTLTRAVPSGASRIGSTVRTVSQHMHVTTCA